MPGKPDLVAPGGNPELGDSPILTASPVGTTTEVRLAGGTSFAAPYVAGMAALYAANNPGSTPSSIKNAIKSSSRLLDTVSDGIEYGAGVVNAHKMLWNGSSWSDGGVRVAVRGTVAPNTNDTSIMFKPSSFGKAITFISRRTRSSVPSVSIQYRIRLQRQNTCGGAWTTTRDTTTTARQTSIINPDTSGNPCWWRANIANKDTTNTLDYTYLLSGKP